MKRDRRKKVKRERSWAGRESVRKQGSNYGRKGGREDGIKRIRKENIMVSM